MCLVDTSKYYFSLVYLRTFYLFVHGNLNFACGCSFTCTLFCALNLRSDVRSGAAKKVQRTYLYALRYCARTVVRIVSVSEVDQAVSAMIIPTL